MVIASQIGRLAAGSAVVAGGYHLKINKQSKAKISFLKINKYFAGAMVAKNMQKDSADAADSYPPTGLSAGVKALPEWIQKGCGAT